MPGLIIFACMVWIVVQASAEKPRKKWASRFDSPLGQKIEGDIRYASNRVRAFITYRKHRGSDWDITEVL